MFIYTFFFGYVKRQQEKFVDKTENNNKNRVKIDKINRII